MTGTRRVSDLSASSRWSWRWHGRGFSGVFMQISFVRMKALGRPKGRYSGLCLPLLAAWLWCSLLAQAATPFDLVIQNGRVIDPESQLDSVRSVGIRDGRVAAISDKPLDAAQVIDATGLVVSPGFINLHSHSAAEAGYRLELLDGVTTVLELEAGTFPIARFGQQLGDAPLTHFGASVGHAWIRMLVIDPQALSDIATTGKVDISGRAFTQSATVEQRAQIRSMIEQELLAGGLGIGFLLDYMTRAVDGAERDMVFAVAAQHEVPVFVHVRRGIDGDPAGLDEVIAAAELTGAAVHICHLNASAMSGVTQWLDKIDAARARGVDVTTEMYPWTAGSAMISSDVFSRDWRTIFSIDYSDVQWAETGEWLTEERFAHYRQTRPGGQTAHHYIDAAWNQAALSRDHVMVASDAMPLMNYDRKVVPNGAGTSSRVLGHYVREQNWLTLSDAIARLSLLPARRMAPFAPAFARKGRIQVGADADLVIFDPKTVAARATYLEPFLTPNGIHSVVVAGRVSAQHGQLLDTVGAGTQITSLTP
ncbi:amidohydrolase family protein [Luminiphilus sp.]|nr:amidohydrolase family protein [Luminiphilus sp.]